IVPSFSPSSLRLIGAFSALLGFVLLMAHPALADAAGDKRRAQMASVKRVVGLPPVFGAGTLSKAETPPRANEKAEEQVRQYVGYLKKMEGHLREWLPKRVTARTPFEVVSAEELGEALKTLKLTPEKLFQNGGRMRGSKFAAPDVAVMKQVAAQVHADAVLL